MNITSSMPSNTQALQSTKMVTPPNTPAPTPTKDSDGDTDGSTASATTNSRLLNITA